MPLAVKINVALREQNCQTIGSERVNYVYIVMQYSVQSYFGLTQILSPGNVCTKVYFMPNQLINLNKQSYTNKSEIRADINNLIH